MLFWVSSKLCNVFKSPDAVKSNGKQKKTPKLAWYTCNKRHFSELRCLSDKTVAQWAPFGPGAYVSLVLHAGRRRSFFAYISAELPVRAEFSETR